MSDSKTPATTRRRRPVTLIAAVAFSAGLVMVALVSSDASVTTEAPRSEPLPLEVLTATLEPGYTVERSFVGRVEARRESPVGFELEGRVSRVVVEEGDAVQKGDVLAELDTDRLRSRRAVLVAQRDQAAAQARLAEITRGRVQDARVLDAVSSQALDEAELDLEARRAVLDQASSAIEQIDVELAKSRLHAPFDALVARRHVDEGQVITAGSPVLHLLERVRPQVRVGVAGPATAALKPGKAVDVEIGDERLPATVEAVLPLTRKNTRTVDVILRLDAELGGPGSRVRSGDLARLFLEQRVDSAGFWLPIAALTESSRGLWAVYVLDGGTLERRELEVLHEEADRVFARGTLQDGEQVARSGLHRLVPGIAARAAEPPSAAARGAAP